MKQIKLNKVKFINGNVSFLGLQRKRALLLHRWLRYSQIKLDEIRESSLFF